MEKRGCPGEVNKLTKSTPTPWSVDCLAIKNDDHSIFVAEAYSEDIPHDEQLENAKLIVQAVNAHKDLLQIAKNTRDGLIRSGAPLLAQEARDYLAQVEAAIRLAEKGY